MDVAAATGILVGLPGGEESEGIAGLSRFVRGSAVTTSVTEEEEEVESKNKTSLSSLIESPASWLLDEFET